MKQIFILFTVLGMIPNLFSQVAPDFTVTDINGVEHNLYSYLDDGKVVVLDVSATWCSKCWSFHQGKYLEDITTKYGPSGTNQVQVIFYEGDKNTTQNHLEGGSGSQGNWIQGTNYPIINEDPLSIDMSVYNSGFPTVSVIRPADKMIIADLNSNHINGTGLAGMEEIIESAFPTSSISNLDESFVQVYPNPFMNNIVIDLSDADIKFTKIELLSMSGVVLKSVDATTNDQISINTEELISGLYMVRVLNENKIVGYKMLTK